jgi:nucleotide-binding universal stress UspA family protein
MSFQDALLHIATYPDPTSRAAIEQAVAFASAIEAKVTAAAFHVDIPMHSNRVADYLVGLSGMVQEEEAKSRSTSEGRLAFFEERAKAAGVFGGAVRDQANLYLVSEALAQVARTRDLTFVALGARFEDQTEVAQTVLFASGRPVILFQPGKADLPQAELKTVAVAWDGGVHAARALREALPLLQRAKSVEVVTFINEKDVAKPGLGAEAVRHLECYGVAARSLEIDAAGTKIGAALDAMVAEVKPDLVVMGAYGHSRLREFALGGATQHMLNRPKAAVLLAH